MQELWLPIAGYEGIYEVSNLGRVRSIDRKSFRKASNKSFDGYWTNISGRLFKPVINNAGYFCVVLCYQRATKIALIHRLVATAFVQNESKLPQVNHLDGKKLNNTPDNLEWCTASYNLKHAYKNGLKIPQYGETSGVARFTEQDILDIRELLRHGYTQRRVAAMYDTGHSTIRQIGSRETWRHVP